MSFTYAIVKHNHCIDLVDNDFSLQQTLKGHTHRVTDVLVVQDVVVSTSTDQTVRAWLSPKPIVVPVDIFPKRLYKVDKYVLVICRVSVHQLDCESWSITRTHTFDGVTSIEKSIQMHDNRVVLGMNNGSIYVWNGTEFEEVYDRKLGCVTCMMEDEDDVKRETSICFGNSDQQLIRLSPKKYYDNIDDFISTPIHLSKDAIAFDDNWVRTPRQNIEFKSPIQCMQTLSNNHIAISLSHMETMRPDEAARNGNGMTLFTFNPITNRLLTQHLDAKKDPIHKILERPNGFLLCATYNGIFACVYAKNPRTETPVHMECIYPNAYDVFSLCNKVV